MHLFFVVMGYYSNKYVYSVLVYFVSYPLCWGIWLFWFYLCYSSYCCFQYLQLPDNYYYDPISPSPFPTNTQANANPHHYLIILSGGHQIIFYHLFHIFYHHPPPSMNKSFSTSNYSLIAYSICLSYNIIIMFLYFLRYPLYFCCCYF